MLPDEHDKDDEQWIERQLRNIPQHLRKKACEGYTEVYRAAYNAAPTDLRRPGAARFAANTRLREYVEKLTTTRGASAK